MRDANEFAMSSRYQFLYGYCPTRSIFIQDIVVCHLLGHVVPRQAARTYRTPRQAPHSQPRNRATAGQRRVDKPTGCPRIHREVNMIRIKRHSPPLMHGDGPPQQQGKLSREEQHISARFVHRNTLPRDFDTLSPHLAHNNDSTLRVHPRGGGVDLSTEPSDTPGGKPTCCATHWNTRRTACASRSLRCVRAAPNPVACQNVYEPLKSLTQQSSGGAPLVPPICLKMKRTWTSTARVATGTAPTTSGARKPKCCRVQATWMQ